MTWGQSLAYKTLLKGVYDKNFPVVHPDELKDMEDAIILDTREKEEFEVSHLKEAIWVGYENFSLEAVKGFPKDKPVVVYCSIGARSQEIGKKLQEAGFSEVHNLYGGIFHWVNEGFPIYHYSSKTLKIHAYSKTWGVWLNKGEKVYN